MINFIVRKLVEAAERYCIKHKKEFHICGTADPDDIYLIRYPLLSTKYLSVYIHRFLRSDADDHHDHPFNFWSYVVTGGYTEELLVPTHKKFDGTVGFFTNILRRQQGSLAYRPGEAVHRVIVDQELKYADKDKAPLTIIVLGKRFREWGFWKDVGTTRIFQPWHEYLNIDKNSEKARKHQ